jgi:hypothetical protein
VCRQLRREGLAEVLYALELSSIYGREGASRVDAQLQQGFRHLPVRDERHDDIREALVHLASTMIRWGRLNDCFC